MGSLARTVRALLPSGEAFRSPLGGSSRKSIDGLGVTLGAARDEIDLGYLDSRPTNTRMLERWERECGLSDGASLTEPQRRQRLQATLRDHSAIARHSLEAYLQDYGFPVYVYEWPSFPSVDGRGAGDLESLFAPTGAGSILRNKQITRHDNLRDLSGQDWMGCGEDEAVCGYFEGWSNAVETVSVTACRVADAARPGGYRYPSLTVIGGTPFGTFATIPSTRRDEFEAIVLRRGRASNWHGLLITYS